MTFLNSLKLPIPTRLPIPTPNAPGAPSLMAKIGQLATRGAPPMSAGTLPPRLNGMAGTPFTALDGLLGDSPPAVAPPPAAVLGGGTSSIQPPTGPADTGPMDNGTPPSGGGAMPTMPVGLSPRMPAAATPIDGGQPPVPSAPSVPGGGGNDPSGVMARLLASTHGGAAGPGDGNPTAI